jgi:2-isopropylmalate synthase
MITNPKNKYPAFEPIAIKDRTWPDAVLDKPPIWCSVDLRDGNQALIEPMGIERKLRMFAKLCEIGFKEIEIGFPSASQADFDFARKLIEDDLIPEDVTIQVLTQAREHLIDRTFESLKGAKKAILHYYNATAPLFRRVVFNTDIDGVTQIAQDIGQYIKDRMDQSPETQWTCQYSPELFTNTELDVAVKVCNAVIEVFQPTPEQPLILNLPATVETSTANGYADQIEWFCRHVNQRDSLIISLHPHNDRGTGVAAAELGVMAGADRVEGTLFGNGERTGNVDIVTLALNMYSQGVHPELDFSDINEIMRCVEYCNQLPIHPRHPYGGELVFTAFSGSHQDAIKKGFAARKTANSEEWAIPYLPIDPLDLGRSYEAVIRVNSQSGKAGAAYLLEQDYGLQIPRVLQVELSSVIQDVADSTGKELSASIIYQAFTDEYMNLEAPYRLIDYTTKPEDNDTELRTVTANIEVNGKVQILESVGNGPLDGFLTGLSKLLGEELRIVSYLEHAAKESGLHGDAIAVAYVQIQGSSQDEGEVIYGVGQHTNITRASLLAALSGVNRMLKARKV